MKKNQSTIFIILLLIFNTFMYYIESAVLYFTKIFKNESQRRS